MINGLMAVLAGCAAGAAELDLAGAWRLTDGERTVDAVVPGGVHDALLAAGEIPDPYVGANETNILWVARRDWTFARDFTVDAHFLAHASIVLRLEDCDTFATIRVNGCTVGATTDRFQRYDFDVKPFLREGVNRIEGAFRSPVAVADERRQAYGRAYPIGNVQWAKNQALIRKPACHGGWDWGPEIETIGFCGTVALIASDRPRIDYVYTTQTFNDDLTHCTLDVFADLSNGTTVTNRLEIDNPPLWWPNGAGEQKFYTFTERRGRAEVLHVHGRRERRAGDEARGLAQVGSPEREGRDGAFACFQGEQPAPLHERRELDPVRRAGAAADAGTVPQPSRERGPGEHEHDPRLGRRPVREGLLLRRVRRAGAPRLARHDVRVRGLSRRAGIPGRDQRGARAPAPSAPRPCVDCAVVRR